MGISVCAYFRDSAAKRLGLVDMTISLNTGDRVVLRDRPWRVLKVLLVAGDRHIVECEALDGDSPMNLSVVIPPEEAVALPTQEVQLDPRGIDSFAAWSRSHLMLGATLIRETGLLTGARFGRVDLEAYQLAPALRILAKPRPSPSLPPVSRKIPF